MTQLLRFEGQRVVTLRLSDLPIEVRQKAADNLIDEEIRHSKDRWWALDAAGDLAQIARDPVAASELIPEQCENKWFRVSAEAYQRALGVSNGH